MTRYTPKDDELNEYTGPNRRKADIEALAEKIGEQFTSFKKDVKTELEQFDKRLELYMQHSDSLQFQMQESLQRQLDQNNEQHKEIMAFARDEMIKREDAMEDKIRLILDAQKKEDSLQNKEIEILKTDVSALKKAPLEDGSNKWKTVRNIAIAVIATALITQAVNFIGPIIAKLIH